MYEPMIDGSHNKIDCPFLNLINFITLWMVSNIWFVEKKFLSVGKGMQLYHSDETFYLAKTTIVMNTMIVVVRTVGMDMEYNEFY